MGFLDFFKKKSDDNVSDQGIVDQDAVTSKDKVEDPEAVEESTDSDTDATPSDE